MLLSFGMGFIFVPVRLQPVGTSGAGYERDFLVGTGATDSMAPGSELDRIGIRPVGRTQYELADGGRHEYAFGLTQIEFMGESQPDE